MPFLNTLGAFNALNKTGYDLSPKSEYFVRYLNTTDNGQITYITPQGSSQTMCFDSSGNLYSAIYGTILNGSQVILSKFDSTGATVLTKRFLTVPTGTVPLSSLCMTIDTSTDTLYIAFNGDYSTSYQFYLMAVDNSFNVLWQVAYTKANTGGKTVFLAKHPTQSYLYAMHGSDTFFIFDTDGVLQNTYNSSSWNLPFATLGSSGPFFPNTSTKIGSQTSNITLGAGYNTVSSVSAKTLTTANVTIMNSTYNSTDGYVYGLYYNSSSTVSGIYKYDFTGSISLKYEYSFSDGYPIQFSGITTDGTYLYVTAQALTEPNVRVYMLKFDTSLNYIDGYKLSSTPLSAENILPRLKPLYYDGKTYAVDYLAQWVMPSDFSTPGTGVYFINGIEYDKDSITAPTRTTGTLAFSSSSPTITTISHTQLPLSPVSISEVPSKFIFVGL